MIDSVKELDNQINTLKSLIKQAKLANKKIELNIDKKLLILFQIDTSK